MTSCDQIANRLAAGEPLNDEQRAHAELCSECSSLMESTTLIGAIGRARSAVVPGPGFSSRMASRAAERVAQRRRRRVAGMALTTAAAAAAVILVALPHRASHTDQSTASVEEHVGAMPSNIAPTIDPTDVPEPASDSSISLMWLTDADRALDYSANWNYIEEPLSPYGRLLGDDGLEEDHR